MHAGRAFAQDGAFVCAHWVEGGWIERHVGVVGSNADASATFGMWLAGSRAQRWHFNEHSSLRSTLKEA